MNGEQILRELAGVGVSLTPTSDGLFRFRAPAGAFTPEMRRAVADHRGELLAILTAARIESGWKPGERIAYRDAEGRLETARFAGVSVSGAVNVWTADGVLRKIPVERIDLAWEPDAADTFEERLAIMLEGGVPEQTARERAEHCTRDYLRRTAAGVA